MNAFLQPQAEKAVGAARALFELADLTWLQGSHQADILDPPLMMEIVLRQLLGTSSKQVSDAAAERGQQLSRRHPEATDTLLWEDETVARQAKALFELADLTWLREAHHADFVDPSLMTESLLRQSLGTSVEEVADAAAGRVQQLSRRYSKAADAILWKGEMAARPTEVLFQIPSATRLQSLRPLAQVRSAQIADVGLLPKDGIKTRHVAAASLLSQEWSPTKVSDSIAAAGRTGSATIDRGLIDLWPDRLRNPVVPRNSLTPDMDYRQLAADTAAPAPAARDSDIRWQAEAQIATRLPLVPRDEDARSATVVRMLPFGGSSDSPDLTTPRQLTTLPELEELFRSVLAASRSVPDPLAAESAQTGRRFTSNDQQGPSSYPLRPQPISPPAANHNHHEIEVAGLGSASRSGLASIKLDPRNEELLLDRLLDRLEERLREQAIRHLGFTGGLI